MSDWTTHRAKVASLSRTRASDDAELLDARRSLKAARLEDYVLQVVESFPPLTAEQLDRVTVLLQSEGPK